MRIPRTYDGYVTISARGKSSGITAETEIPVRSSSGGGISIGGGGISIGGGYF